MSAPRNGPTADDASHAGMFFIHRYMFFHRLDFAMSNQRLSKHHMRTSAPALAVLATFIAFFLSMRCMAKVVSLSGPTMGTTYHVKFVSPEPPESSAELQKRMESALEEINRQMSTYRRDSEISRFNRAVSDEWFGVSPATATVAATALELSRKTDGALDVTVGPLVRLWHFGPPMESNRETLAQLEPPGKGAIQQARARVGYDHLEVRLNPPALKKRIDRLEIDLSSVAGGYAVDRVAALLIAQGIDDFMVEIGGELRTGGRRADGKLWRIAIERPVRNRRDLLATVPLSDAALATSGDYRNYFEYEGRRYSHIIDPTTGWPIEQALASVSVVAGTCMTADAWDTALLVLGPERGFDCAEKHDVAALFVSRDGSGDADQDEVRATSAWVARFGKLSR
jgi:FAD:protein FMN transferase